jgi:hypothetical protein
MYGLERNAENWTRGNEAIGLFECLNLMKYFRFCALDNVNTDGVTGAYIIKLC